MAAKSLTQRVFGDQGLELGHELGVAADFGVGLEELFEGYELQLLEPGDLVPREVLVDQVCEWRPTPKRDRLAQLARALRRRRLSGGFDERRNRSRSSCSASISRR